MTNLSPHPGLKSWTSKCSESIKCEKQKGVPRVGERDSPSKITWQLLGSLQMYTPEPPSPGSPQDSPPNNPHLQESPKAVLTGVARTWNWKRLPLEKFFPSAESHSDARNLFAHENLVYCPGPSLPEPISRDKDWLFMGALFSAGDLRRQRTTYLRNGLTVSSPAGQWFFICV